MAKKSLLNVRSHLEHVQLILDGYKKYGACPLIDEEVAKLSFMNRAILAKHNKAKAEGSRKDIR